MLYALTSVLLLGILLLVLNNLFRVSPRWLVVKGVLLRFNLFDEAEGNGKRPNEEPILETRPRIQMMSMQQMREEKNRSENEE